MHSEGTIDKKKRRCTEWEKILGNDLTDKELIANVYKQLIGLNIFKKWKILQHCKSIPQ